MSLLNLPKLVDLTDLGIVLKELSDARDEIDSNNEVIRDTLDMLPTGIMETLRKHGVLDGLVEILDKAEARKG